jgi:hypothetical protein
MSQFSQLYGAATTEVIATIADTLIYKERAVSCVISEETYGNAIADGGFEPTRSMTALVRRDCGTRFRLGDRVTVDKKSYRIAGINTDEASIELTLQSPDQR